jgi:putative ABC transport system permease protein
VTSTRKRAARLLVPALVAMCLVPLRSASPQRIDSIARRTTLERTIAIDERLAADAGLRLGDRVVLASEPGRAAGDTVRVAAIVRRGADPSEVARSEYRIRVHLDQLQRLIAYGDRVDRFAMLTTGGAATDSALGWINSAAFGFRAYRSRDIAVETSKTFLVVSRFHRAIGMITIVASATFLLCIMLLKVDERRRDVAAMRLMGISRRTVVRSVMLESSFVALLGSAFGVGLGIVTAALVNAHYQAVYRTPLRFAIITPSTVGYSVLLSLILGIGAGALAARRLARTPPLALFGR